MNPDEVYEAWRQARARADVPPGFADAVMARLREDTLSKPGAWAWLLAALGSRPAALAACSLAALACALRLAHVLGIFLPEWTER